jgi:hypothetical protein
LGFWAQRRYGFRSEHTQAREGFTLWMAKVGIANGISMGAFTLLVESFGFSYIAVRWALNFTIGPLSYVFNKRLIFRGSSPLTRLTSQLVTSGILLWIEFRLWLRKRLREVQKT